MALKLQFDTKKYFAGDETHNACIIGHTTNITETLLYLARVTSEDPNSGKPGLIDYLLKNEHFSPLESVHFIVEINGFPRTIVRQAVRHKSNKWEEEITENINSPKVCTEFKVFYDFPLFHTPDTNIQEFSYRYGTSDGCCEPENLITHAMLQHPKNRQCSLDVSNIGECQKFYPEMTQKKLVDLDEWWLEKQQKIIDLSREIYLEAIAKGMSRERARNVLPEGLTPTKLNLDMNLRSFVTFCLARNGNFGNGRFAQPEIQFLADLIFRAAKPLIPIVCEALEKYYVRTDIGVSPQEMKDALLFVENCLKSSSSSLNVLMDTTTIFLKTVEKLNKLKEHIYEEIKSPFVKFQKY